MGCKLFFFLHHSLWIVDSCTTISYCRGAAVTAGVCVRGILLLWRLGRQKSLDMRQKLSWQKPFCAHRPWMTLLAVVQPVHDIQKAPQPLCASVSLSLRSQSVQLAFREKALGMFRDVQNPPLASPGLIWVSMLSLHSVHGHPLWPMEFGMFVPLLICSEGLHRDHPGLCRSPLIPQRNPQE